MAKHTKILPDFYKLVVSIMNLSNKKRLQRMIKYEDYKNFLNKHFKKFWKTVGPNFSSKKPIN